MLGWDVGGANLKVARLDARGGLLTASRAYEVWRGRDRLGPLLGELASSLGATGSEPMGLTMTAELSDTFRTKREGVHFVLDTIAATFPTAPLEAFTTGGRFVTPGEARERPLALAASNWLATALWLAPGLGEALLVDAGSTTCDVVPIVEGRVAAAGRTDLERLQAGELLYTGALRTPVAALVRAVTVRGRRCPVSAEHFAISADAHLVLGLLAQEDYTCPTPDGRPAAPAFARERLARVVCADLEELGETAVRAIARAVLRAQTRQLTSAFRQVCARFPGRRLGVVPLGIGAFLARRVAERLGLPVRPPPLEPAAAAVAPCVAVAHLLAGRRERSWT